MIRPVADSECDGPAYDGRGELSAPCRVCGKCDAVARLVRKLAPAAQMKNETMRPATHAAR
jgi:hypothetical protein